MNRSLIQKILFWIWISIPVGFTLYFSIDVLISSFKGSFFMIIKGIGLLLAITGIASGLIILNLRYFTVRFITVSAYFLVQLLFMICAIATRFRVYVLLFSFSIATLPLNIDMVIYSIRSLKSQSRSKNLIIFKKKSVRKVVLSLILFTLTSSAYLTFHSNIDTYPRTFQVTGEQMEQTDFVLYYWNNAPIPAELNQVLVNTNTTISVPINFDLMDPSFPLTVPLAESLKNASDAGVKIELFTTFPFLY